MTVFTVISQIFIFFVFAFKPKPKKIKTLKKITDIGIIYVLPLASPQILKVEKSHKMETRNNEKFMVQHANTNRLKDSAVIYMQHLLNKNEPN